MSSFADHYQHGFHEHGDGRAPLADAWGHHAPGLLCASIGAAIVVGLLPPPGALGVTGPVALMLFVLASWLLMRRHDRRLCEQCVAAMPLDAAQHAARLGLRFRVAHNASNRRFVLPYLAVLIGSNFFPGTPGRVAWVLAQASMIYLILSYDAHRKFQPWCPVCSDGGGGSERAGDIAPPPLPDNDRQLV